MSIETHRYRADIDGIRALAIVPVVFYHAGIPGFSGGFVGVDVFFVISGYLITSIIEREIRENRFSLAAFYERRIRRILPALFSMMAFCAIVSPFFLYPEEYRGFARSLITATLFVSSVQFRRESGYFDLDASDKPLLHTWSLSVEELFYVFFPIILILSWRWFKEDRTLFLCAIALVSFIGCVGALFMDPQSKAAFYLPHFRAWEFLIGVLLALTTVASPHRRRFNDAMSIAGLLMIMVAVHGYSETTIFPGWAALLPCLGAAFIILSGQHHPSLIGRFLSHRPFVLTGLISYSLYLWHWPILVFAGLWIEREASTWEAVFLGAASFVVAALSWRYIERPFRGKSGLFSRRELFYVAACISAVMVTIGLHGEYSKGWVGRYPKAVGIFVEAGNDRDARQKQCLSTDPDAHGCTYGNDKATPTTVLWGDSQAAAYAVMLGKLAEEYGSSILALTMPACPPVNGWQINYQEWRHSCSRFQELAKKIILETEGLHTVIVAGNMSAYVEISKNQKGFRDALQTVIDILLSAGKRIILVYPFPTLDSDILKDLSREAADSKEVSEFSQPLSDYLSKNKEAFEALDSLGNAQRLIRVYPHKRLCDNTRCFIYQDGQVLYYDDDHINLSGAEVVAPLFKAVFTAP